MLISGRYPTNKKTFQQENAGGKTDLRQEDIIWSGFKLMCPKYASVVAELSGHLQFFGEVDRLAKLSRVAIQIQKDLKATNRELDEYLMCSKQIILI